MNKILKFALILIALISVYYKSFAQSSVEQAQAIFIYNFTRLIEWPVEYKSGDFVIGVLGSSDVYIETKNYVSGKTVGNQQIVVKNISSIDDANKCHILFVSYGKTKEIPNIIEKFGNLKTLIISEKKVLWMLAQA